MRNLLVNFYVTTDRKKPNNPESGFPNAEATVILNPYKYLDGKQGILQI